MYVYESGTTTNAKLTQAITTSGAGSVEVTGLTASTSYDIMLESDVYVHPSLLSIGNFTTLAT